jgi:hypothetical protein
VPLKDRQAAIQKIEVLRGGRRLVSICNFDRQAQPSELPGLAMQFQDDVKEPLFRVLKETLRNGEKLDLLLYTRGGATNAVWPIAGLLREFDPNFEVLVPFRNHSAGTMLALAAKKVVMTRLGELSPIDPTTANAFNPRDPTNNQKVLGIAVEDVLAYQEFWKDAFDFGNKDGLAIEQRYALVQPHFARLSATLDPIALGNVHRTYAQIRILAKMLLKFNYAKENIENIIVRLSKQYYSHLHMINRHEAMEILGSDHVDFADATLEAALDSLLRQYEEDFEIRHAFFLSRYMGDDVEKEPRFIGGAVGSATWSYLFETKMKIRQYLAPPSGVQVQVPPGTVPPLVAGLPRKLEFQVIEQGWGKNLAPKGVTL